MIFFSSFHLVFVCLHVCSSPILFSRNKYNILSVLTMLAMSYEAAAGDRSSVANHPLRSPRYYSLHVSAFRTDLKKLVQLKTGRVCETILEQFFHSIPHVIKAISPVHNHDLDQVQTGWRDHRMIAPRYLPWRPNSICHLFFRERKRTRPVVRIIIIST